MLIFNNSSKKRLESTISLLTDIIKANGGYPNYEAILENRYSKWLSDGDVVIDIGAHKGRHLSKFIELVGSNGQIIGFEPLPLECQAISEKYALQNVKIYNIALSESSGEVDFVVNQGALEESGLVERVYNDPDAALILKIKCRTEPLDFIVDNINKLDFIKIDTEGGEIGCLKGGKLILEKFRPLITVEYGQPSYSVYGHTKHTLFDFAKENRYIIYDLFLNSLENGELWAKACDSVYWDYFMVPKEKEKLFLRKMK